MAIAERPPVAEPEELLELWEDAPGIPGFLSTVDHKRIGMRYIYTCFFFFFAAGLMALMMRAQLATPDGDVLGPQTYNEMFTMHGVRMIFLFNTPAGRLLLPAGRLDGMAAGRHRAPASGAGVPVQLRAVG